MKLLFFNLIFFISDLQAMAQKAEYFEFSILPQKVNYSVFDKVEFADNRLNQDYIGITRRRSDNKLAPCGRMHLFPRK